MYNLHVRVCMSLVKDFQDDFFIAHTSWFWKPETSTFLCFRYIKESNVTVSKGTARAIENIQYGYARMYCFCLQ